MIEDQTDDVVVPAGLFGGAARMRSFEDPDDLILQGEDPPQPDAEPDNEPSGSPDVEAEDLADEDDPLAGAARARSRWPSTRTEQPTAAPGPMQGLDVAASTGHPSSGQVLGDRLLSARLALVDEPRQVAEPAQWGSKASLRRPASGRRRAALAAQQLYLEAESRIRTFQWPSSFNVMVANKKGGANKTPTTVLLAGVLAQIRGGGVVAFEASESAGTLADRSEGGSSSARGLTELLQDLPNVTSAARLAWFTQPQTSGAAVIASVQDRSTMLEGHVRAIRDLLDQYYSMSVTDTGNDPSSTVFYQCVTSADVLVLPTVLSRSSVMHLVDTLLRVRDEGTHGASLAANAVVIASDNGLPHPDPAEPKKLREVLNGLGVGAVVDVPFDPHIAAGAEISLGRLSDASQRAWVHATAAVLACATARINH